ncbi:MAG: 30S ribosomal protein S6 [Dehalococcoidia bacterium]
MNEYELVTILSPDIEDENLPETLERIHQFITSRGGEIQNVDQWGRRKLAYPIARQFEGIYVVTLLRMKPAFAAELEANLRISELVLRHLLVRQSPSEAAAALAASQRRRPRARTDEQQGEAVVEATVETGGARASVEDSADAIAPSAAEAGSAPSVGTPQEEEGTTLLPAQ